MLFGSKKPQSTKTDKINSIRVTQSVLGQAQAIIMGQHRASMNLIWYGDFKIVLVKTPSPGGGKGLGGGGTASSTTTYYASVVAALCQGPVAAVLNLWDSKGGAQLLSAVESFTIGGGGGGQTYQVTNHALFAADVGVAAPTAYSQTVSDYGAPAPVTLSGTSPVPLTLVAGAPGPNEYSVDPATGTYTFSIANAGQAVTIVYSFYPLYITKTELTQIPASTPWQVLVLDNSLFWADQGVRFYPSLTPLTKVSTMTGPGQYTVTNGLYQFWATDASLQVLISYQIKDQTDSSQPPPAAINFTLINGTTGQAPWGYLSSMHPDHALGYSGLALICSSSMLLGSSASLPNYSFEVLTDDRFGGAIVDCDPATCIEVVLLDPARGLGSAGQTAFPASVLGDLTQASNFWVANNFFISPVLINQQPVASVIQSWIEAGMTAAFFSEGKLKFMPYGDTSAAANGQVYQPQTQPVVDLNDDDFVVGKAGEEPIKVSRSALDKRYNRVQVQWANRQIGYNNEITYEQDDTAINRYGILLESSQTWDFITTLAAAQFAASMRVKRYVNIVNTYEFHLGWLHSYLEPMDLVTLTTNGDPLFNELPVRIIKVVDDPLKGLTITAEDFPWGTATASRYPKQTNAGFFPVASFADPGDTSALIIEAPNVLAQNKGNILYIFCGPTDNVDWGGCDVYLSFDNTSYSWFGRVTTPARTGTLAAILPVGIADPDLSTALINMDAGIQLASASASDFDQAITLSALFSETPSATTASVDLTAYITRMVIMPDGVRFPPTLNGVDGSHHMLSAAQIGSNVVYNGIPVAFVKYTGTNLCPDSSGNNPGWTLDVLLVYSATGGAISGGKWTYTGTGAPSGFHTAVSSIISVIPGSVYRLSAYIDATHVTGALPFVALYDPTVTTAYGGTTQAVGANGRVYSTITIPGGVTQAVVVFGTNNATVGNAQPLVFSNPQFELGAVLSAYQPSYQPSSVICSGQVITLPNGPYVSIVIAAIAIGNQVNQTFTVTYQDSSTQNFVQSFSDWRIPQGFPQEFAFLEMDYVNNADGTRLAGAYFISIYTLVTPVTKNLKWLTLPTNANLTILSVTVVASAQSSNFELFAYGNATLSGANQYQLTPLHRGLKGTPNVQHSIGEAFVRLDEASLEYQYDPSFVGKTIYFKFASFNALGGHPQLLSALTAIPVVLQGLGPGAVDAITGTFLGTQDKIPGGSYLFARTAAHSSYRPLTNPLTAHDVGASVTISVAAFFMRSPGFPDVSVNSGTVTNLGYGTLYYVFYSDLYFLGGAVTYLVSTVKEDALNNSSYFYVGSIRTPSQGAADTVGTGDGGTGAQTGSSGTGVFNVETTSPGIGVTGNGTVANIANWTDNDPLTYALLTVGGTGFLNVAFLTADGAPLAVRPSTLTLKLTSEVPVNSLNGSPGTYIGLTIDWWDVTDSSVNGNILLLPPGTTRAKTVDSVSLPPTIQMQNLRVKAYLSGGSYAGDTSGSLQVKLYNVDVEWTA